MKNRKGGIFRLLTVGTNPDKNLKIYIEVLDPARMLNNNNKFFDAHLTGATILPRR
jgi:hypothetical protein